MTSSPASGVAGRGVGMGVKGHGVRVGGGRGGVNHLEPGLPKEAPTQRHHERKVIWVEEPFLVRRGYGGGKEGVWRW